MRLINVAPLAAAILLAGCGGDADTNDDGKVTGQEAVAEAANAIQPQPGQYRTTTQLLEFNIPGASDEIKQRIQAQMGGTGEVTKPTLSCLTPEQASTNGPEEMAKKMAEGNCTVARFDVSGGSISAEMQCVDAAGGSSHVLLDGQMTSTSSTMTMTNESDLPNIGKMQMKARVTSERVGDCPG